MDIVVTSGAALRIGATGMEALLQNIRIIVLTTMYSVPLDRGFAHVGDFIDSPSPLETARLVTRLTDAIEAKEPRVKVRRITLEATPHNDTADQNGTEAAMQGRLYPHIYFELKEGVDL